MERVGTASKDANWQWRTPPSRKEIRRARATKQKSLSVLFAVIGGPITYIYTWRRDRKLIVFSILWVAGVSILGVFNWHAGVLGLRVAEHRHWTGSATQATMGLVFAGLLGVCFYLGVIVSVVGRSASWYREYGVSTQLAEANQGGQQ